MPDHPHSEARVLVAADLRLVADTVGNALAARGVRPTVLDWAEAARSGVVEVDAETTAGLLMSDLVDLQRVLQASVLIRAVPVRWIVYTVAPRGAAWGAVLDAGADIVLPAAVGLAGVVDLVRDTAEEELRRRRLSGPEREALVESWRAGDGRRGEAMVRMVRLTPAELDTLRLLYAGRSVAQIADLQEVGVSTVRGRVRSVLDKLDVHSSLAAVAVYGELVDLVRDERG